MRSHARKVIVALLFLPLLGHAGEFTVTVEDPANELPAGEMPEGLLQKARRGDPDAQWELATLYIEFDVLYGEGRRHPETEWLLRAARQDHAWACNELGMGYLDGEYGLDIDLSEALRWLTKATTLGDEVAAYNLARLHSGHYEVSIDEATANFWLSSAGKRGVQPALFELAFRTGEGVGMDQDPQLKAQYLANLRLAGYALRDYLLDDGFYLLDLELGDIDAWFAPGDQTMDQQVAKLMLVFDSFELTYEGGKAGGKLTIGDDVVKLSLAMARDWASDLLTIAARLGNQNAQRRLAEYHEQGDWVVASPQLAEYWQGRADAQR